MADALSRRVHGSESELVALSVCRPVWLEAILNSYHEDAAAQQRIAKLALAPDGEEGFSLQEGVVRFQGRIWIDLGHGHSACHGRMFISRNNNADFSQQALIAYRQHME